jgi:acyl-CoA thioesterase
VLADLEANPPRPVARAWDTPPPWQRPVRGAVQPQETWSTMSGLDFMRACISGEDAYMPPIAHLLGVHPEAAEEGAMTWSMPASEWSSAPVPGRMYGGAIAYFAGNTIDGTVMTTVPAGSAFAPVDLKVYFLRPVVPDGRRLTATGSIIHRGRSVAIASAEVRDADGRLAAIATGSALIQPGRSYRATAGG